MTLATEVEARFAEDGGIRVLNFTWQGRRQAVTSQGRQWEAADGRHVLVMTPGERVFELVYERPAGGWVIARAPGGSAAA